MAVRFRISGLFPSQPSPLGDSPALPTAADVAGRVVSVLVNRLVILRSQPVLGDGYFHALSPYTVTVWTITEDRRVSSHRPVVFVF